MDGRMYGRIFHLFRADFRLEKPDFRFERADIKLGRANFRHEGIGGRGWTYGKMDGQNNKYSCNFALCSTRHRPFGATAEKRLRLPSASA